MAKYRISKVYTRQGDDGQTGLAGGQRVDKCAERVEAYGAVDELGAALGAALAQGLTPDAAAVLERIQSELFNVGSDLCVAEEDKEKFHAPTIEPRHIEQLEAGIDRVNARLAPLEEFILRGGGPGGAALHLACTVCRRAERATVRLAKREPLGDCVIPYLNRLSDLLFVMARAENQAGGFEERAWDRSL